MSDEFDSWLLPLQPRPRARRRLYCFPFAGGGIAPYARWIPLLPDDIELVGVQLPGRENRIGEAPLTRFNTLLDHIADAVAEHDDGRETHFFGHCAGAMLAYECARALHGRAAAMPASLLVSAAPAPSRWDNRRMTYDLGGRDPLVVFSELGAIPRELIDDPDLAAHVRAVLHADTAVYRSYRPDPRPPLPLPVSAFAADRDTLVAPAEMEHWQHHTDRPLRARRYDGTHFSILDGRSALLGLVLAELAMTDPLSTAYAPGEL
ncbi:thioesterase II family protein [Kutzneria sp. NPDC052558]|uniref:thioesterase II family protein n=1 Tax=Kutzneria sp. NPDC052558 TaxID=3364121 RepID=UPI0037C4FD31